MIDKSFRFVYLPATMEFDEKRIGERIRSFRQGKGVTLDQLASVTGLTKGYLSRIENSEKSPPVSTLAKIAFGLNVEMMAFLADEDETLEKTNIDFVRSSERKIAGSRGALHGYMYESLSYRLPGKNMEPFLITIDERLPTTEFQHEGEEFIFLLQGKMEFFYEGRTYLLTEGDSIYFNAAIPHSGKSVEPGRAARFLCIIYSYKRI